MTPTLRSPRLILTSYTRPLVTQEHVDWLNDRALLQYSEQQRYRHTLRSQLDYVEHVVVTHFWVIRCNGADIGTMKAYVDEHNRRANLGILLGNRLYHGQGFAAEAWETVMVWLFGEGINKIEAGCQANNNAMRRLAITTGMTLEGEIPGHFRVGDEYRDLCLYGRFARDVHPSQWEGVYAQQGESQ